MESLKMSLQIFWKNDLKLASEITCGRGQIHYVFLAGIIISENYKFAKIH